MTHCTICGEDFDEREDAEQHFAEQHTAEIDEALQEYIPEATQDAMDSYLEERE